MPPRLQHRTAVAVTVVVVVLLGTAVFWWFWPPGPAPSEGGQSDSRGDFHECALRCGLTFRMSYLPNEQGETFKVNLYDHGSGVAVGDFDGDSHDDIYFCNQLGENALYRNKGNGTFEDVTDRANVGLGDRVCVAATFADYDNDGHLDLFVTSTRGGNVLFRNKGDGTFEDVTRAANLTHVGHSQAAVFFDYDNDGYLDLFVANTAEWTTGEVDPRFRNPVGRPNFAATAASPTESNILYHNKGDGTFEDVTARSGLKGKGWAGDAAAFDYDGDGRIDLLVTNMFGASQLYRNKGDGTFEDVTRSVLGRVSWGAIGVRAFDFNNDGKLDLFLSDMHSDMWLLPRDGPEPLELARRYQHKKFRGVKGPLDTPADRRGEKLFADLLHIRYDDVVFGNTLFENLGGGKFREVSDKANMETFWPWGIVTGDFDNDGYEDVYLPSGMGYPYFYWPCALMMNNGNGTFTDRAREAGIEPPPEGEYQKNKIGGRPAARSARSAAAADFDGDGRLDLVVNNFNDRAYYFRNAFPKKNYIAFRLTGTWSNRDAIGALVTLHVGKEVMVRQVHGAGGYLSQSSNTVHFGLGDRTAVTRVEIRWPRGDKQTIEAPAINRVNPVREPDRKRGS